MMMKFAQILLATAIAFAHGACIEEVEEEVEVGVYRIDKYAGVDSPGCTIIQGEYDGPYAGNCVAEAPHLLCGAEALKTPDVIYAFYEQSNWEIADITCFESTTAWMCCKHKK